MSYHFRNLVFEGGGVKSIAYLGALEVLEEKNILPQIERVGGTSAGAINALILSLGYTRAEQTQILRDLDFNKFMDSEWGYLRDAFRLINEFGWYKGDFFSKWIGGLIAPRLGQSNATFRALKEAGRPDLYIIGTNLSTELAEVFSYENSPDLAIADAVRISMSIPLFFRAIRRSQDLYVDGGVVDNYPVKLFDQYKFIRPEDRPRNGRITDYYERDNQRVQAPTYVYNRETLGFRLDSTSEIRVLRDHQSATHKPIKNFVDYMKALMGTLIDVQSHQHLHSDDWQRTIYIDTLGVGATEFEISQERKDQLIESGRRLTRAYFEWYDKAAPVNKPSDGVPIKKIS
ncbi:MAG: patatin-like phospholipase family protein [Bdellovibrionales bacterium]